MCRALRSFRVRYQAVFKAPSTGGMDREDRNANEDKGLLLGSRTAPVRFDMLGWFSDWDCVTIGI